MRYIPPSHAGLSSPAANTLTWGVRLAGHWSHPLSTEVFDWVRDGNIGEVASAAIPSGLGNEVCGGGCPQLASIRLLTGMEVAWVEGWALPPEPTYDVVPVGADPAEADCAAFGRLGFANGAVCRIGAPPQASTAHPLPADIPEDLLQEEAGQRPPMSVTGTQGTAWLGQSPVLIRGQPGDLDFGPLTPPFLAEEDWNPRGVFAPWTRARGDMFGPTVQRLIDSHRSGEEPLSSGHDYRQVSRGVGTHHDLQH